MPPYTAIPSHLRQDACQSHIDSINFLLNNSSTPTFNSFEILAKVSMSGCEELVHHLETVDGLMDSLQVPRITIYWFSSVPLTLISGDLRLAYISNF